MLFNLFLQKKKRFNFYNPEIIEKHYVITIFIKYILFIILYLFLFFYKHIYINIKGKIKVEIDNIFEIPSYEKDINFSNYLTNIKPIAIYYSEFNNINKYSINIQKNEKIQINDIILEQIKLAKSHGIFGFAINYIFDCNQDELFNIFLENKNINFSFLIIWNNNNFKNYLLNSLEIEINKFIKKIKKYLISSNYIKINKKPAILINNPLIFKKINETIFILREKARENGIGELFIISPLNMKINESEYISLFDAIYDIPKINILEEDSFKQVIEYYSGIIYKNIIF